MYIQPHRSSARLERQQRLSHAHAFRGHAIDMSIVRSLEAIAVKAFVQEQLNPKAQLQKSGGAQLFLKFGLPPTRFVLVSRPALPAIESREHMIDGKWDAAPFEVLNHVPTPNRNIRHVKKERATRCQHAMYIAKGFAYL